MKLIPHQVFTALVIFILGSFPTDAQQIFRPAVRTSPPLLRDLNDTRLHERFEVRVGPRFGFVSGAVRPGLNGSSLLDLRDDLKLTDPGPGAQVDFEVLVSKQLRATANFSSTFYNSPNVTTTEAFAYHSSSNPPVNQNTQSNPAILPPGSTINTDLQLESFSFGLEYQAYKDRNLAFGPTVSLKYIQLEEKFVINNATTGRTTIDETNVDEITPLVGMSLRYQINPNLYCGLAPSIYGGEKFFYITGNAYLGYDFEKLDWGGLGIRLGLDVDQIWSNHTNEGSVRYNIQANQLVPFLQIVYGF